MPARAYSPPAPRACTPATKACDDARDALAQSLYVNAFEWVVAAVNAHMCKDVSPEASAAPGHDQRFVGLLDIFGFENFAVNSFEQLCINFTNERLQAHFMDALVKLRVLEYEREGVPVADIDFPDNEAQLAIIDGKARGAQALWGYLRNARALVCVLR